MTDLTARTKPYPNYRAHGVPRAFNPGLYTAHFIARHPVTGRITDQGHATYPGLSEPHALEQMGRGILKRLGQPRHLDFHVTTRP